LIECAIILKIVRVIAVPPPNITKAKTHAAIKGMLNNKSLGKAAS